MNFSPIRPGEQDVFTVNYAPILSTGETILRAVWSCSVVRGTDPDPAAMVRGDATISGPKVSQMIAPRVPGMTYRIVCTAQTNTGRTLVLPDPGLDQLYVPA